MSIYPPSEDSFIFDATMDLGNISAFGLAFVTSDKSLVLGSFA